MVIVTILFGALGGLFISASISSTMQEDEGADEGLKPRQFGIFAIAGALALTFFWLVPAIVCTVTLGVITFGAIYGRWQLRAYEDEAIPPTVRDREVVWMTLTVMVWLAGLMSLSYSRHTGFIQPFVLLLSGPLAFLAILAKKRVINRLIRKGEADPPKEVKDEKNEPGAEEAPRRPGPETDPAPDNPAPRRFHDGRVRKKARR